MATASVHQGCELRKIESSPGLCNGWIFTSFSSQDMCASLTLQFFLFLLLTWVGLQVTSPRAKLPHDHLNLLILMTPLSSGNEQDSYLQHLIVSASTSYTRGSSSTPTSYSLFMRMVPVVSIMRMVVPHQCQDSQQSSHCLQQQQHEQKQQSVLSYTHHSPINMIRRGEDQDCTWLLLAILLRSRNNNMTKESCMIPKEKVVSKRMGCITPC